MKTENQEMSLKDVAKAIRTQIKAAKKTGKIAKTTKISVRTQYFSMGCALHVTIKAFEGSVQTTDFLKAYVNGTLQERSLDDPRYTEEIQNTVKMLEEMVAPYHFDDSDMMTDYHNCNFYQHIGVCSSLEYAEIDNYKKALEEHTANIANITAGLHIMHN